MLIKPKRPTGDNRRQLVVSLVVLLCLLFLGAAGFYLLGDGQTVFQSLYLTSLILTTVGMKEGGLNLNTAQKVWAMVVMLAGISAALYAAGNVVAFVIDGELRRFFGSQQMQKKIARLEGHYIVCGFGRMGKALSEQLQGKGVPFVLVEHNEQLVQEAQAKGYLVLQGDAMMEEMLTSVRVDQAAGLASCLRSDADNVFVTLTARGLNTKLNIITCAQEIHAEPKLRKAGADKVICPQLLTAHRMAQMLIQPGIEELLEPTGTSPQMEVSKVSADQVPGAVGKSLRELSLPTQAGVMVVAIVDSQGHRQFNPSADTRLGSKDQMVVISQTGGVDKMVQLLGQTSTTH